MDIQDEVLQNARILIVDDQEINILLMEDVLKTGGFHNYRSITDSREVLSLFATFQPDIILLDLMMPNMDGFEVMELLTPLIEEETYLPILVLTADVSEDTKRQALWLGANDFLTKPLNPTEVRLRIKNLLKTRFLHVRLQNQNYVLEEIVLERTNELRKANEELQLVHVEALQRLAIAAEYRDDETGQHTKRVGDMASRLAAALGLSSDQVELIHQCAPLHDIGKIGIADAILLKPGKLTSNEFEIMKKHTVIGARILSGGRSELIKLAQSIALTHHERWDGSGYPHKLQGGRIPIAGRIVAIADVFDALTHDRPYKEAWPIEEAVAEIKRQSGTQFDPRMVEVFVAEKHEKVDTLAVAGLRAPGSRVSP